MIAPSSTTSSTWATSPPWGPPCEDWASLPIRYRLTIIRRFRAGLVRDLDHWIQTVTPPWRTNPTQTLSTELFPLADAARFLEKNAARILRPRRLSQRGAPIWLRNTSATVHREPLGWVLIIAPSNYPLALAGIQTLQALAAGNSVAIKPSPLAPQAMTHLVHALHDAGVPESAVRCLDPDPEKLTPAYPGIDKLILTGSAQTGRAVEKDLAGHLVPATMELSGVDAMVVLPRANHELVRAAIEFAWTTNASATCIAPRRLIVVGDPQPLIQRLRHTIDQLPPITPHPAAQHTVAKLADRAHALGCTTYGNTNTGPLLILQPDADTDCFSEDVMAPVLTITAVDSALQAAQTVNRSPYGLGASIFGPVGDAEQLAHRLDVGTVTINDVIIPTADPRLPLSGRRLSGYGTTRGDEGLLDLTRTKVVTQRPGKRRPIHLDPDSQHTAEHALPALFRMAHAQSWKQRLQALAALISAGRHTDKENRS